MEESRSFGYLCPHCKKPVLAQRTRFALSAAAVRIECACEKSELRAETDGLRFRLWVPCGLCGETHQAELSSEAMLEGRGVGLACPKTKQLCCYIGEQTQVEQAMQELRKQDDWEAELRYFFLVAINARPYFQKSLQSNYGAELEMLMKTQFYRMFEQLVAERGLYQDRSQFELKLILRYHSLAILGILKDWTEEDNKNLDRIVHEVFLLMTGSITPFFPKTETDTK